MSLFSLRNICIKPSHTTFVPLVIYQLAHILTNAQIALFKTLKLEFPMKSAIIACFCLLLLSQNGAYTRQAKCKVCGMYAVRRNNIDAADRKTGSGSGGGSIHTSVVSSASSAHHFLLEYILHMNPTMKRPSAKKFLFNGNVFVNDEAQSQFNLPLIVGDRIDIKSGKFDRPASSRLKLDIIFEDENLLVVNKPSESPYLLEHLYSLLYSIPASLNY